MSKEQEMEYISTDRKIEERILELYEKLKKELESKGSNGKIDSATYYERLKLINPDNGFPFATQGAYVFKIIDELEKPMYQIYDGDILIAEIDETGQMSFTQEYKDRRQEYLLQFNINIGETDRLNAENFVLPDELAPEDRAFSKEEMEQMKMDKEREDIRVAEERKQEGEIEEATTEEKAEEIAKSIGVNPKDIAKTNKITPGEKITKTDTFESFLGVSGKYTEIYATKFKEKVDNYSRFAFVGIDKDGNAEIVEARKVLHPDGGKEQYDISLDGDVATKETPTELFMLPGSKGDRLVSITIGDNGNLEVDCVIWDKTQNEYIAIDVRDQYTSERPDPTTMRALDTNIKDRRHIAEIANSMRQEISDQGKLYDIERIDGNKYNLKGIFQANTTVVLESGKETTLGQLAEEHNMNVGKYIDMIEDAGDGYSTIKERVNAVENNLAKSKDVDNDRGRVDRDPGEEALERLENHGRNI